MSIVASAYVLDHFAYARLFARNPQWAAAFVVGDGVDEVLDEVMRSEAGRNEFASRDACRDWLERVAAATVAAERDGIEIPLGGAHRLWAEHPEDAGPSLHDVEDELARHPDGELAVRLDDPAEFDRELDRVWRQRATRSAFTCASDLRLYLGACVRCAARRRCAG